MRVSLTVGKMDVIKKRWTEKLLVSSCWTTGCHLKKMDLVAIRRHEKVGLSSCWKVGCH